MVPEGTPGASKAFDSGIEYRRWCILRDRQAAGLITDLRTQPSFKLRGAGGTIICRYKADFSYWERGVRVVEDVKSPATAKKAVYRLKLKLMLDNYNITIREIYDAKG